MSDRRKTLIISDAWLPQLNGVVRTYQELIKQLEACGHSVKVIGPADFPRRISMPSYPEIKLAIMPYQRLKMLIESYAPDSIHIATEGSLGWAGRKYCLKNSIKFTSCYHTQFPEYIALRMAKLVPFLYKPVFKACVAVIKRFHAPSSALLVTTNSIKAQLKNFSIKTPMHIFTRGVDTNVFHLGEKTLFQDLKKPIALYVGRLAIEKNIEEFLDMEWVGSKVIVGHGPDKGALKEKYPNAIFTGKKEGIELADHYRSADVFVFPSRTDTFGIVLIEALACGLPIAAHDVTGPYDIVTHKYLGTLNEDLSQATLDALNNGASQARHDYVAKNFNWSIATQQFLKAQKATFESQVQKTLEK